MGSLAQCQAACEKGEGYRSRVFAQGPDSLTPSGYLDAASGLPMSRQTSDIVRAALRNAFADPTRRHSQGRFAKQVLESARAEIARVLVCQPDAVRFASSAPEAIRMALHGLRTSRPQNDQRWVTSPLVRNAVRKVIDQESPAAGPGVLPVDARARVVVGDSESLLSGATALVIDWAVSEVGTVQPLDDLAGYCQTAGAAVILEASGALGYLNAAHAPWDILIADAASFGGPRGIAVLAARDSARLRPPYGLHAPERGFALSEPSVALAAGAAAALVESQAWRPEEVNRLAVLTDRMRAELAAIPDVEFLGDPDSRLPHLISLSILYASAEGLVDALAAEGISVDSGSACTSDLATPSHVLTAIGALTQGNLRCSLPPGCAEQDVDVLLSLLPRLVERQRAEAGL